MTLRGVGKRAGLIHEADRKVIDKIACDIEVRFRDFVKLNPSRQQQRADALSDSEYQLLRECPAAIFAQADGVPMTRALAKVLKLALVVAILGEAPLDLPLMCGLKLAPLQQQVESGVETLRLSVAADAAGNWIERAHELSPKTSALLKAYLSIARDKLNWSSSAYLLPGQKGMPMTITCLSSQLGALMSDIARRPCSASVLLYAVRDRLLARDPDATEFVRAARGHSTDSMAIRAAQPFKDKAMNTEVSAMVATGQLNGK